MSQSPLVLGLDFGTDSVRCVAADCQSGEILATVEDRYKRWSEGKYCSAAQSQFRQHPADHIESLTTVLQGVTSALSAEQRAEVVAIGVDSTGSTPIPVDESGTPLASSDAHRNDPAAMFWLWKDHTSAAEADEIAARCRDWGGVDFSQYCGGDYSPEWFWAKLLKFARHSPDLAEVTASWVEHCDWTVAALTGATDALAIKRSRCAAGHKGMWHAGWDGWPATEFLESLHPALARIAAGLPAETLTSDQVAGTITRQWSDTLGLPDSVRIGVGQLDAHAGAIGGGVRAGVLLKVIGTSTCDMAVTDVDASKPPIKGIAGEVDGSIIPGQLGIEAGQSAFGDIYQWFKNIVLWPVREAGATGVESRAPVLADLEDQVLAMLDRAAQEAGSAKVVAVDWWNGRRSPHVDMQLTGMVSGLQLGVGAPQLYCSLVEATAFGARRIVEHLEENGVDIDTIIAVGGIARKSPFVMQTLANVLNRSVHVVDGEQACALGAAICAATAAGQFGSVEEGQQVMASKVAGAFEPDADASGKLASKYATYKLLGEAQEQIRT